MTNLYLASTYLRRHFGHNDDSATIPSLVNMYVDSFSKFLQINCEPNKRELIGLESSLRAIFPLESRRVESIRQRKKEIDNKIKDIYYYSHYVIHPPIYTEDECKTRGLSYLCSVYLIVYKYSIKGQKSVTEFSRKQIEKNMNLLEKNILIFPLKGIPYMTAKGTFIINGIERVIVSQLQRCPGIYYSRITASKSSEVKIIPYYGTNLMIERNFNDKSYVRVGGKRRIPLLNFLISMGISFSEIVTLFYNPFRLWKNLYIQHINLNLKNYLYGIFTKSIKDAKSGKVIIRKGSILDKNIFIQITNSRLINISKEEFKSVSFTDIKDSKFSLSYNDIYIHILKQDTVSYKRKIIELIYGSSGSRTSNTDYEDSFYKNYLDPLYFNLSYNGRLQLNQSLEIVENEHLILTKIDIISLVRYLYNRKRTESEEDSVYHIQNRKVKLPGDILNFLIFKSILSVKQKKEYSFRDNVHVSPEFMYSRNILPWFLSTRIDMIFRPSRYVKLSHGSKFLSNYLFHKIYQHTNVDDRLYQTLFITSKKEIDGFITSSNLSQLLDQVNPLSSITHLRRLSLLGPEGLQRDNVSMDTRDVQSSFFGRICPIETPEGKSVGIVNSLAIYSHINSSGDILSPYIQVNNRLITSTVHFLDSRSEYDFYIALSSEQLGVDNRLKEQLIYCKHKGEYKYVESSLIDYIDISPRKILSVSSSLIPYIEHNDGNRALMGANMQRQAVVNIIRENPISATGLENFSMVHGYRECQLNSTVASIDSKHMIISLDQKNLSDKKSPIIIDYDLSHIPYQIHAFTKFEKNNQKGYDYSSPSSLRLGGLLHKGSLIADHSSTLNKDISIGHNILVGFTSMNGYSFEDSIVVSDRLLKDDLYTSFHTKEFIAFDWDTFQSKERITRNIPYISKDSLNHLDSAGIIRSGTKIQGGDIVVGKILVDRKNKSVLSERDKFLQEILAGNGIERDYIKDTSERVPQDVDGIVLQVKKFFFSDTGIPELFFNKDKESIIQGYLDYRYKLNMLRNHIFKALGILILSSSIYSGKLNSIVNHIDRLKSETFIAKSYNTYSWVSLIINAVMMMPQPLQKQFYSICRSKKIYTFLQKSIYKSMLLDDNKIFESIYSNKDFFNADELRMVKFLIRSYKILVHNIKMIWYKNLLKGLSKILLNETTELPIRLVKVLIGYKHKIKSGDKMTGRHGNKGVISKVTPMYDMPYTQDGTPLDIILNPIGISSRMNLGQVFETYFGISSMIMAQKIHSYLNTNNQDSTYQDLRQILYHIYGHQNQESSVISKLSTNELKILLSKLSRSILYSSSSFNGASIHDSDDILDFSNLSSTTQSILLDPMSGEKFDRKVTIGLMYILKLSHLVDEKIHARFTGPYNRVTEQPLGGKSMDGGQRFGEMEVWALQAYGAAYTLLDMLTVKSDLKGRSDINNQINVSSNQLYGHSSSDFPEAFNVLLREIWCLGLNLEVNN